MPKKANKKEANTVKPRHQRARVLKSKLAFNKDTHQFNDAFMPTSKSELNEHSVHTTMELMALLEKDKKIEIEATVMAYDFNEGRGCLKRINGRDKFMESFKESGKKWSSKRLRESDYFGMDSSYGSIVNGKDFTPLLGGPFYKQLYMHDYLRMHAACFYAWHHNPIAKATIEMIVDFVLGRGFKVESPDPNTQVAWDAFHEANNMDEKTRQMLREELVYGETMIWKLPNNQTKVAFQLSPGQTVPKGLIPRIQLIDPSVIWEIITYPEDITRVIAYQWVAPTQYQIYTAPGIPSTKFIFTQIPADQIIHTKINCASNEKRGRSELFASLGYMKRLDDAVDYSLVSDMKRSAWAIDTQIRGSQEDVDNYYEDQQALGTIPAAGSEFIHTEAVTRTFLSNPGSGQSSSASFEWALSMAAAGNRIPTSYYGTHLSGGQARASALVSTEPVAKMFESKQQRMGWIIKKLHRWVTGKDCDVIFPEIISQDSATKIRNIVVANANNYFSKERSATMIAKELNVTDFNYETEEVDIKNEMAAGLDNAPLTSPGQLGAPDSKNGKENPSSTVVQPGAAGVGGAGTSPSGRGFGSQDKDKLRKSNG